MKKQVFYYSLAPSDSTAFWRTTFVLPYINSDDFFLVDISSSIHFNKDTFKSCDLFIFQRPFTKSHADLIMLVKGLGIKVICDYDDNLFAVDIFNPTHILYAQNAVSLTECIKMADELWVSTQSLSDEYKHINTHVICNAHNDYLFPISDKKAFVPNKKVMYRGGSSHKADVYEHSDILIKIINKNKDWTFLIMGDRYEAIEMKTGGNHHIVNGMPIMTYFNYLSFENPSIMIFPLCNTPFNKAKSNISFLEATYAGAAFFGNNSLSEFDKDFIFNFKELPLYMNNDKVLQNANELSWEYITDNLLLSKINEKRFERIIANL